MEDTDFEYVIKDKEITNIGEIVAKLGGFEDIEEQLGCPLDIRERALKQKSDKGLFIDTVDNDGKKWKGYHKCELMYDGFNNKFYWTNGFFAEYLDQYKKTWWLKSDKIE